MSKGLTNGNWVLYFLIALIGLMFAFAVMDLHAKHAYDWLSLCYCALLTIGPFTVVRNKKKLWITVFLACLTLLFHQLSFYYHDSVMIKTGSSVMWASFNGLTAYWFFQFVNRANVIGNAQIYAAICVYILIALTFSVIYVMILFHDPTAFTFSFSDSDNMATGWITFVYFSLTTLTTVGYGDITPKSNLAKYVAVSEAVVGVFYVAILISRLISLQLMHQASKDNEQDANN